jgi:hypothetical protein
LYTSLHIERWSRSSRHSIWYGADHTYTNED